MRLENKVAIVTGGATGIGEAIASKFCREGAQVVVTGGPADSVDDIVERMHEQGGEAVSFLGDLSNEDTARECVESAIECFGKLDILVNNAGVLNALHPIEDYPTDKFEEMIASNILAVFMMTRAAIPELKKSRGCIVSAGSEAAWNGAPNFAPYAGTKGFIHSFMKGVAVEQARNGIRANCVCPGPVNAAMTEDEIVSFDSESEETLIANSAPGRHGTVEEIANAYTFLASDEASYVNGALWLVDGGTTTANGNVNEEVPHNLAAAPGPSGDGLGDAR
ncbi:MAG TPA: SDR family oxidoreductase [Woeseiaceae bacterium]|nr:SDR family oxidoreductase [Woeseiaceae bacterium]